MPYLSSFVAYRFEAVFALRTGRTFSQATEALWRLTLNTMMLRPEDSMRDGYRSKMLLYALDELFYIFSQVKSLQAVNEKVILAYEILCLSTNWCTDRWNGVEKTGVPDTLALLNLNDACHLERLAWVVYDGVLLAGPGP